MIRLGALAAALALAGAPAVQEDDPGTRADELARLVGTIPTGSAERDQEIRVAAFEAFVERMDAFDGPRAEALARAMHAEANAVWSAFCFEGALRRSAPADASSPEARAATTGAHG